MEPEERSKLVVLLRAAAAEMLQYGPAPIWNDYDTCDQFGRYIGMAADQVEAGDDTQLKELWKIFAPTCDWDDARGSCALANEVFAILDSCRTTDRQRELDRRLAELDANPDNVLTWQEIKARVKGTNSGD